MYFGPKQHIQPCLSACNCKDRASSKCTLDQTNTSNHASARATARTGAQPHEQAGTKVVAMIYFVSWHRLVSQFPVQAIAVCASVSVGHLGSTIGTHGDSNVSARALELFGHLGAGAGIRPQCGWNVSAQAPEQPHHMRVVEPHFSVDRGLGASTGTVSPRHAQLRPTRVTLRRRPSTRNSPNFALAVPLRCICRCTSIMNLSSGVEWYSPGEPQLAAEEMRWQK
jgi:hypothetical protein